MSPVKKTSRASTTIRTDATASLSEATNAAFAEDAKVRNVLTQRLAPRGIQAQEISERATAAFSKFRPSMFSAAERVRRTYLAPGESLADTMRNVVERGVATMRETADDRTLHVTLGEGFGSLAAGPAAGVGGARRVGLDDLMKYIDKKLGRAPTLTTDPTRTACEAEARANEVLSVVESTGTTPAPAAPDPTPATPNGDGDAPRVKAFVAKHVDDLLAKTAPPEDELRYDVQPRAKLGDTERSVDTFQLRAGASDVTAYHDYKCLHIAFEHVWEELFDSRLQSLGQQLYEQAVEVESFLRPAATTNLNFDITSIPDLLTLMRDIQSLSSQAANAMPTNIAGDYLTVVGPAGPQRVAVIPGAIRLSKLLDELALRLKERYAFTVFAKNSYNFGMMVTYRQTWTPEKYQVGDLVSTIPLAPRESRKYTTRSVVKKTRAAKEVEESLRTTRSDTNGTSRVEREIIDKAQARTHFDMTVQDTFGGEGYQADITGNAGGDQATQSEKAKKHFHEAVLKSAQEYKQQHRMEIDTTTSEESEETTTHEIQNPNDELTVTYMFYELQRTFRVREKIHQLTPVILVANEVPAPDAIDDAWLIAHDWILRRVLLDDSFKPALEFLTKSFVGAELNLRILDNNAKAQKAVVDELKQQVALQNTRLQQGEQELANRVQKHATGQEVAGAINTVKRIFDPLGLTGKEGEGTIAADETMVDYLQETYDRSERERQRLLDQLGVATTALRRRSTSCRRRRASTTTGSLRSTACGST